MVPHGGPHFVPVVNGLSSSGDGRAEHLEGDTVAVARAAALAWNVYAPDAKLDEPTVVVHRPTV